MPSELPAHIDEEVIAVLSRYVREILGDRSSGNENEKTRSSTRPAAAADHEGLSRLK